MTLAHRDALRERLRALPSLSGCVVAWSALPQNTPLPAVRLATISDQVGASHQGSDKRGEAIVQIDVFADDPNAAHRRRDAILADLHGFRGAIGTSVFDALIHEGSREDVDPSGSYSASLDFRVIYQIP